MDEKKLNIFIQNVWVAILSTMLFCSISVSFGFGFAWGFLGVGATLLVLNLVHDWDG